MQQSPKRHKILLVDDDADFSEVATVNLNYAGFSVTHAKSAKDAIKILKKKKAEFAIILSDHNMPHLSGLDFLLIVRGMSIAIPFYILSSNQDLTESGAISKGAHGLFRKPIAWGPLFSAIHAVLGSGTGEPKRKIRSRKRVI